MQAVAHPALQNARQFVDAQEQAHALSGWNQEYLQLSAGAFAGQLAQVQGPGMRLFIEQVQQTVLQTGVLAPHVLALGLPLQASGTGLFCGQPCDSDDLHVFSGASGFEFRTSRQHTMLGIELQLEPDWLVSTNQSEATPLCLPSQASRLHLHAQARHALRNYLLRLLTMAHAQPEVLTSPAVVLTVADFLLDALDQVKPEQRQSGSACAHWALVQRACAHVQDQLDQAPTVAQLCVDLGVSRRTLQNGFLQVLNISPLAYLKACRLNRARTKLKTAHSVTEAATACGFWHFGHFSHDYLVMFGERPSDTRKRHHRGFKN